MLKSYKVEIKPTKIQINKIRQTFGVCRFIYNLFIYENIKNHENKLKFITAMSFSKWLNNIYLKENLDKSWIKEVSSKSVKQAMFNAEKAFKRFFKKISKYPNFKKRSKNDVGIYLPKNNKKDFLIKRYKIKIPIFGFVRLKEFGYIKNDANIRSCTITYKAGKYFISFLVEENKINNKNLNHSNGIGLDLGIKDFVISSDGRVFKNINKSYNIKKLEKNLKHHSRKFSGMLIKNKNLEKGGTTKVYKGKNLDKQKLRLQKIHFRLSNIRKDYISKVVNDLVKTTPKFITIENLNVSGMMKNRHLSKSIQNQNWGYFKIKLIEKCKLLDINIRQVNRNFPSSKKCNCCGNIKKNLKLSDRIYVCDSCGLVIDRDLNASYNLRDCNKYLEVC